MKTKNTTKGKKEYCISCGSILIEVPTGWFLGDSGKAEMELQCRNIKCCDGCLAVNGGLHNMGFWGSAFGGRCKNCGSSNAAYTY